MVPIAADAAGAAGRLLLLGTRAGAMRLGYAACAGIEYALAERVSVEVEGLYVDLDKEGPERPSKT